MTCQHFQEELSAHLLGVDLRNGPQKTSYKHLPVPTTSEQTKAQRASLGRRHCKLCQRSTAWQCEDCNVGLCLQPDRNSHILSLEQQLLEKDSELAALRESLTITQEQTSSVVAAESCDQIEEQDGDATTTPGDSVAADPDILEESTEEDTTLTPPSCLAPLITAAARSSFDHSESKGASSDEMVTSTDSEVAHSSWTLLDAVNQDGSQEWPSVLQDFGQLQMQSWEEASVEQETTTVRGGESSVVIHETVQIQLSQQGGSPTHPALSAGQVFAQALAEELQRRYSELLAELQRLRETSTESKERILSLEEERNVLISAKKEAESQVSNFDEELQSARQELDKLAQQGTLEKNNVEMNLLEEQMTILKAESETKEHKIQELQSDLERTQQALSEQEIQASMLCAQLGDRELLASELERKLQDMESSLLEYSQCTDVNASLVEKDSEINELRLRLTEKKQEMSEVCDGMSAKLLQVGEEKFAISSEVKQLKEQLSELEKVREQEKKIYTEGSVAEDELGILRKDKEALETQLGNMKKKLQVALVQRKELMRKVADFEGDAKKQKKVKMEQDETAMVELSRNSPMVDQYRGQEIQELEAMFNKVQQSLKSKEQEVESLQQRISQQDRVLSETHALNARLSEEALQPPQADDPPEVTELQSQLASLQSECETLHKKLLDAQESRKETIRKAKEKDRHHREQLKQHKEEYNDLMGRFEWQSGEHQDLLTKLSDLEKVVAQNNVASEKEALPCQQAPQTVEEPREKLEAGGWVQEDWVDFAAPEGDSAQHQEKSIQQDECKVSSSEMEMSLEKLREECQASQMARTELEEKLHFTKTALSQKEIELEDLGKELEGFKEREKQADVLSEEIQILREKFTQAESYAETIKLEMEATAKVASESSVTNLQAEVEEFKVFLDNKNQEIQELSQQLSEQNSLLRIIQTTVSQKDQFILSLQEDLKAEQEKTLRLENEVPLKQEEDREGEAKVQQLQRKLQAALISRKDLLKENKTQKEELAVNEQVIAKLKQNTEAKEAELEKLQTERVKLIDEVDRTLVENQSLGSSCESLKLAMEGILSEKDACQREVKFAKEEAARTCKDLQEKTQSMREEYETLLKSYENVSDEAERVRRVLEAARQERQELAAKIRTHEVARQDAEKQVEDARKEVDLVKDKMRKFAKTKQHKILDLEEENERLRDIEERKGGKKEDYAVKVELKRLKEEQEALKVKFDATVEERNSLVRQVADMTEQLAQQAEKEQVAQQAEKEQLALQAEQSQNISSLNSGELVEESIITQQSATLMAQTSMKGNVDSQPQEKYEHEAKCETLDAVVIDTEAHLKPTEQPIQKEVTDVNQDLLEDKMRDLEGLLGTEREQRLDLEVALASLEQQLEEFREKDQSLTASLQQSLQEVQEKEQTIVEESSRKEAQLKELRRSLEAEKDDLEERLMNQLARLNGSIAGYQQEVGDTRERLADLQRDVERLERERAELEAQAQSEIDRAARLEEDKRQAQRERAEAEAESGKQRELEQQLRSAQRVREGSQNRARQLEELLREKQLEMRQLQNDSIKYQERISELGRETKALKLGHQELQKQLDQSHLESSKTLEHLKINKVKLVQCKSQLDEAQKTATEALAEKGASEQAALQREDLIKSEAEQTLDAVRFRLGAELKEIELRLEEAYRERDKEEEATLEAREVAAGAERQAQKLQAQLDESLARLAAFSRCMSSLQDDRDRVLDEVRQWETRFSNTLQGKESEVRQGEARAKDLSEQLQKAISLKEELQSSVERLEKINTEQQLRLEEEDKKIQEVQATLELEWERLQEATAQLQSAQADARALGSEVEGLSHGKQALEEAVERLQGEVERARAELVEREVEERRLCLHVEQLETDLRSSKVLLESLQMELSEKEQREMELLGEKEQAIAQAAEEARLDADGRAQEAEAALEQRRVEGRDLEERLRKTEEESNLNKARLDSFMKAMGSLQDDRDQILVAYKQLEEKHLQVMMEKDGLIQEAAGENNGLKEELRSLLAQRDDLYAERAKLASQLHNYREELNQVLTLKESQHKQALAAQRECIASLEKQRQELEAQVQSLGEGRETQEKAVERETLSRSSDSEGTVKDAPGAEVEKLREQLQAAREQAEALEESLREETRERDARGRELAELRWGDGVMRTESENAQERVAELARDLLMVEQRLLEEKEATTKLRAENKAFGKAMASLQDSREQAEAKAHELGLRLEEVHRAGEGQTTPSSPSGGGSTTGEVWSLKNALQALQNDRERLLEQMQKQGAELRSHKAELVRLGAGELIKISQELAEERTRAEDLLGVVKQLEETLVTGKQEVEMLRLERVDWLSQVEQREQQTLAALSYRDQQLSQMGAMLAEARTASKPRVLREGYQREGTEETNSAPGAPQERAIPLLSHANPAEVKELRRRLDEESEQRAAVEEQLLLARDQLQRHTQGEWLSARDAHSDTAVLIEPPGGAIRQTRQGGPSLKRMLRTVLCSRQRTPLLLSLYLLGVHVLLLLCLGGYL
ncbi:Golgin subfamily B member 1 [Merluccius polli]|uniref:Golgin subfamily B member 1 n=1 Tax=Merluccius polli TaxID=89951 RepID=A0AA47M6X6_MERPO|nr:Golgin subfamily B member 1 [Merluccius polli]